MQYSTSYHYVNKTNYDKNYHENNVPKFTQFGQYPKRKYQANQECWQIWDHQ
jgi:hypothetical protein